jgi:hypothetical protein
LFRQNIVSNSGQSFIRIGRVFPAALQRTKEAGLDRLISVTDVFVIDRITTACYSLLSLSGSMRLHERAQSNSLRF